MSYNKNFVRKEYNSENLASNKSNNQKPYLSFYKSGVVWFSKGLCDLMGLQIDDRVVFVQNEASPKDWYIEKNDTNGFLLRKGKGKNGLEFNRVALIQTLAKSLNIPSSLTYKIPVAQSKEHEMFPLITKAIKQRNHETQNPV